MQNTSTGNAKKVGLMVAGAVAAGVVVSRFLFMKTSSFGKYKSRMEEWLTPRLTTLMETLAVTPEVAEKITDEIQSASRACIWIGYGARKANPEKSDMLEIVLEKRLLKMKSKVHKLLEIKDAAQSAALHGFYEELRAWLIPVTERAMNLGAVHPEARQVGALTF